MANLSKPRRMAMVMLLAAAASWHAAETLAASSWEPAWDGYGSSSWYDDSWGFGDFGNWFGGDGFNNAPWDSWSPWSRRRSRNYGGGGYRDGWNSPYGGAYGDRNGDRYGYSSGDRYRDRYDRRGAPWWGDGDRGRGRGRDSDYGRYRPPGYFDDYPSGGRYSRPYERPYDRGYDQPYDRYDSRRGGYDRSPYDRAPRDRYYDTPAGIDRDFKLPPYDEIQPDSGYDSPRVDGWGNGGNGPDAFTGDDDWSNDWSSSPVGGGADNAPSGSSWDQPDTSSDPVYSSPPPVW